MAKKKDHTLDFDEILRNSFRQVKKEKAMDYDKPLNIIEFAEKLLAENLTAGQRIIMKFYYAGSRFNEDLKVTKEDVEIIKSFDIEQTWITYGDNSKLNWNEKYLNINRRNEEYDKRRDIYDRVVKGQFVPEEEQSFKPLWFLDLILVLGRRSGKSYLSSLISSYEAYKLLMLKDPQIFYRINSPIYILNTATSAEQAESIIFNQVKSFIKKCPVFDGRIGKTTQNELHILVDRDLKDYGVEKAEGHMHGHIILKSGSSNSAGLRGKSAICLEGNTIIADLNGGYSRIENYIKEKECGIYRLKKQIMGMNGFHKTKNIIVRKDDIYEYKFSDGTCLYCTKDHKIFINEKNNFIERRVDDLILGDKAIKKICIDNFSKENFKFDDLFRKYLPHFNKNKIKETCKFYKNRIRDYNIKFPQECNSDLASILGYLISEGNYTTKNTIKFGTTDEDIANDYCKKIKKVFNIDIKIKIKKRMKYKDFYVCNFSNDKIKYFLSTIIGLKNKKSKEKIIPECIFKSKKETVSEFLKSIFEGDGIQSKNYVGYGTISKRLILDICFLLNEFGIKNYIKTSKTSSGNIFYILKMYNFFANEFYRKIGFFSKRRQSYNFIFNNMYNKQKNILLSKYFVEDLRSKIKLKKNLLNKKDRSNLLLSLRSISKEKQIKISRKIFNSIEKIYEFLSEESKKEFNINKNYEFVEFLGCFFEKNDYVYDFSFGEDEDKSFFADSFLNHNCVIYDEMAHFVETNGVGSGKEVYNALSRSSATFKLLGDGRQIVLSSPYTPSGQFYDLYVDSKNEPSILMFQVPTWNINPRVPKSILESEFRQDPELAATEYGAQFLRRSESVYFPHDKIDLAMEKGRMMQLRGNPAHQYYLHIDAAETSDRYAFMLGHSENRFDLEIRSYIQYVVEDYSYFIKPQGAALDPDVIVDDYILPLFPKFNIVCVSFDGVFTREQRKKISYRCPSLLELRFAGKQKFDIYTNTRNLLMSNRIELCAEDVQLQGELKNIIVDYSRKYPTVNKNPDSKDFPNDDLCFDENTLIRTKLGFEKIKNMKIGDEIYTVEGTYEKVKQVFKTKYNKDKIYELKIKNFGYSKITENHPVLTESGYVPINKLKSGDKVIYCFDNEEKDIKKTKFDLCDIADNIFKRNLKLSKNKESSLKLNKFEIKNSNFFKINNNFNKTVLHKRFVDIDEDLLRLFGYFLAEGSFSDHGISFSFHIDEKEYINDVKNIIKEKFNLQIKNSICKKCNQIYVNSVIIKEFFINILGKNTASRKKIPNQFLNCNKELQKELLKGYWRGDGCLSSDGRIIFSTTSSSLALQIRDVLFRFNIVSSTQISTRKGKKVNFGNVESSYNYDLYNISIKDAKSFNILSHILEIDKKKKEKRSNSISIYGNKVITKISLIKEVPFEGEFVYNLEVNTNHNYTTNNITVHNCDCLCGMAYAMTLGKEGHIRLPKIRLARTGAR